MKKKILSLIMATIMVISMVAATSVSIWAATAECTYTVDGGAAVSGNLSDAVAACTAGKTVVVTLNSATEATGTLYAVNGTLTVNGGTTTNIGFKVNAAATVTLNNVILTRNSTGTEPFLSTNYDNTNGATFYANGCTFNTVGDSVSKFQFMIARGAKVYFDNCTINADGKISNAVVDPNHVVNDGQPINAGACFSAWGSIKNRCGYLYLTNVTINTPNDTYGFLNAQYIDGTLKADKLRIYMTNVKYDAAGTEMDFDTNKVIAQADGASVRTVSGSEGLRFTSTVSKGAAEYADNIVWKVEFRHTFYNGFTIPSSPDDNTGLVGESKATDMGKTVNTDGSVSYNTVLVNIPNYTQVYSVKSTVVYEVLGGNTKIYIYSNFDSDKNSRSIEQVAEAALDDVKTIATPDEKFPYGFEVTVNGAKYFSRYTAEQYEVLKKYAGADYAFTAPTAN